MDNTIVKVFFVEGGVNVVAVLVFVIGCALGSFLRVVSDRLSRGESFVLGRSHCDVCGATLRWYDLVPILSWVCLRGRCRYCGVRLSVRLLWSEILCGLGCLSIYLCHASLGMDVVMDEWVLLALGLLCAWIDFEEQAVYPSLLMTFFAIHMGMLAVSHRVSWDIVLSMLAAFALYGSVVLFGYLAWGEEVFGMGDVYYLMTVGSWFTSIEIIAIGLLAFVIGGGAVLVLHTINRLASRQIPFIPAIVVSEILVLIFGIQWLGWG